MIELFSEIPEPAREIVKIAADMALAQEEPGAAARMFNNFVNKMPPDPNLKDFADFYFIMRLEQMKNEE